MTARGPLLPALALVALAGAAPAQAPWVAPPAEAARPNPEPASEAALKRGRVLYQRHCAMCHGDKGKGDGPAARLHAERANRAPQDLTDAKVQASMSDGEIYWKVGSGLKEEGRVVMPGFAQEIPKDEDRWKLVHFVRSFAGPR